MDRFIAAEVLMETVARGSISAAAMKMGMSRAMASRYICLMEEWAGARLLHRTTRKLNLTTAGEKILPLCKEILALSGEVKATGSFGEMTPRGLLRISASSIFSEHCLTDALADFLRIYREVSIDLQIIDRVTNPAEDGIDLAIRVTNSLDPNLIVRKLGDCHSVICASPEYLSEYGTPAHVCDLAAHNCITYANFSPNEWHFSEKGNQYIVPVGGNYKTNESAVVMRAALAGTGIAMLPLFAAKKAISEGKLTAILSGFKVKSMGVYAVYLSREHMLPSLRAIIDYLSEHLHLPEAELI